MTLTEQVITIAMCSLGTMATRFLPFLVFRSDKPTPKYIQYLGKVLPGAIFGMLIVYCLRSIDLFSGTHGLPELLCVTVCALLHLWKRNELLSIFGSTILYMVLVQVVFQ